MTVLDRSELQASPLADLHVIADQIGLEGFRRLRKAELIDAILGEKGERGADTDAGTPERAERGAGARRSRSTRSRRGGASAKAQEGEDGQVEARTGAGVRFASYPEGTGWAGQG